MTTKIHDDELDRDCVNCNYSFPSEKGGSDHYICLKDPDFDPYIDRLIEEEDFACCAALIKQKRFPVEREACADFDPVTFEDAIEVSSEFGEKLRTLSAKDELSAENLSIALAEEAFDRTDWSKVPIDKYIERLKNATTIRARSKALNGFSFLIKQGNRAAFDTLCGYIRGLPAPQTSDDSHFRSELLRNLSFREEFLRETAQLLVEELFRTPSNNQTRSWYTSVFKFFNACPYRIAQDALQPMLDSKQFSYRIKKRIKSIIY